MEAAYDFYLLNDAVWLLKSAITIKTMRRIVVKIILIYKTI